MKRSAKISALFFVLVFTISLLLSCNTPGIDTSNLTEKPNISDIMFAYETCRQKKTVLGIDMKFTMYQGSSYGSSEVNEFTFGQLAQAARIQNGDKIYMDATLSSSNFNETSLNYISSLSTILSGFNVNMQLDPNFLRYLNSETYFSGKLGFDGIDMYNFEGDYSDAGIAPDYLDGNGFATWCGITETSVQNMLKNMDYNGNIRIKDYMMFPSFIDFSKESGWITGDSADKYYNEGEQAYLYSLTTSASKMRTLLSNTVYNIKGNFNGEVYAEEYALFDAAFPKLDSWATVYDSKVTAKVSSGGKLQSITTENRIDIDVDIDELMAILSLTISPENRSTLTLLNLFLRSQFKSSTGESGIMSIRIDVNTSENIYYDDASIDLSAVDQDMFLASGETNTDRYMIVIEDKKASGTLV